MSSAIPEPVAPGPTKTVKQAAVPPRSTEKLRKVRHAYQIELLLMRVLVISHFHRTSSSTSTSIPNAIMPMIMPTIVKVAHDYKFFCFGSR
eukprot:CAMPEP_0116883420 /NCGR_PEP_ID=MMETSP0463-20121206/15925_1 /TAXON_ID=181622 /ORGANISM="Strombidinopsis sp, Strain SopsisLIS2011" /LENGTH=90 /DNA_ID=CAMNT_0004538133 /DNA_START=1903 /DNA_END=2175 /DNA_ORIENTATION=+